MLSSDDSDCQSVYLAPVFAGYTWILRETEVKDTFALGQGYTSVPGKGVTIPPSHYLSAGSY